MEPKNEQGGTTMKLMKLLYSVLLFITLTGFPTASLCANEQSKYLDATREFADNILNVDMNATND